MFDMFVLFLHYPEEQPLGFADSHFFDIGAHVGSQIEWHSSESSESKIKWMAEPLLVTNNALSSVFFIVL